MGVFDRPKVHNKVYLLPSAQISANPSQPRRVFDKECLASLAQSIKENGLIHPIVVLKAGESCYQLISGERRLLACRINGMETVPCIIEERTQSDSAMLALIENLQREDLNCFEEAEAIAALAGRWNISQEELSRRLGRSQSGLSNKLRLLRIPEPLREIILENRLTERHARALLTLETPKDMEQVLRTVVARKLNVHQTEEYIASRNIKRKTRPKSTFYVRDIRLFANTITKAVTLMNQGGINAVSETSENDEFIEYRVKIPKHAASSGRTTA